MRVYFSTVVRNSPVTRGGALHALDWDTKRIVRTVPIVPTDPPLDDPNPRGNTRGGRGIALVGDEVAVCSFHTVRVFDRDLNPRRDLSNGLMAGLHEVHPTPRGTLWITSTAIDAAFEIDFATGAVVNEFWPREIPSFRKALDLDPLPIDKQADNRARFLSNDHVNHPSHVHLNAVATFDGRTYGLLNRFGAIVDLDGSRVVVREDALKGAHNLVIDDNGVALVNDTRNQRVFAFDVTTGWRVRTIKVNDYPLIRRIRRRLDAVARVKHWLHERGVLKVQPPRPLFMRGLDRAGGDLLVGLSPALILRIDEESGRLKDAYRHSRDVRVCVHGLKALRNGAAAAKAR